MAVLFQKSLHIPRHLMTGAVLKTSIKEMHCSTFLLNPNLLGPKVCTFFKIFVAFCNLMLVTSLNWHLICLVISITGSDDYQFCLVKCEKYQYTEFITSIYRGCQTNKRRNVKLTLKSTYIHTYIYIYIYIYIYAFHCQFDITSFVCLATSINRSYEFCVLVFVFTLH